MRLQTRIFVAKQFAKKHYAGAMDAMKSLKGKFKKDDYKKLRQSQKQTAKEIQDELNKLSLEDSKVIQETFEIEDVMDIFGDVYKDLN